MSSGDHDAGLAHLLMASEALDEDVGKLLGKCRPLPTKRAVIAAALCRAAFEHALSQRLLLAADLSGTALALSRLHFEAVVRAAWTGQGAPDNWIEAFTVPGPAQGHKEPTMGPPIPSMLEAFGKHAPHVAAEFRKLYGTITTMHSFVHGGSQMVAHSLMGAYPADKLVAVLLNRNLLQWYTANCAVVVAQDEQLVPRMRLLREKYGGCMPPIAAAQTAP